MGSAGLVTLPAGAAGTEYSYRRVVERLAGSGVQSALLDAACLMEVASGIPRWWFILDPDRPIAADRSDLLESMVSRREAREPMAYILGVKEFWSLSFTVSPDVLIPRPDTEILIETALDKIGGRRLDPESPTPNTQHPTPVIVDLGTGSGAIALALAVELPHALIYAIDRSPGACRIARRNITALGLASRVRCIQGDLLEPIRTVNAGGGCDLIVSNPPYVPSGECGTLSPEITIYEPVEAIDGGPDGLYYYRRIIEAAPTYLREGGWLVLEVGDGQAPAVTALIRDSAGFGSVETRPDVAGCDRVVCAQRYEMAYG
ncbi:MAG: peptide chain release factor N(5)-glutamine methyltransferase [Candidatus Methylomirabilota bacterium]|nr:peptide chain release factor N(5)-glutamine methyltransferase [Candidatus Methylomirabilis sp.]NJD69683.1 peptide chain release factor N(5)-glutamine methyltransferase [candidate division NC10 bacterium]PWB42479.1 MAG: peptide chain release factor N(5)-glutamine methyltransferase [candidate division NC10 bacterium]